MPALSAPVETLVGAEFLKGFPGEPHCTRVAVFFAGGRRHPVTCHLRRERKETHGFFQVLTSFFLYRPAVSPYYISVVQADTEFWGI